jgi:ubiquitin-conjugating enzyme E2 variant
LAFASLEVWLGFDVVRHLQGGVDWLWLAGALLLGYVLADFASGLIHWLFDRYGTADTPVVGRNFVQPFREHHIDPKGITRHDFVETNGNNCIATLVPLLPALLVPMTSRWTVLAVAVLAATAAAVMATNQFHKWAHDDAPSTWVRALQWARLVLESRHHEIHHTAPYDKYYCITTGWLNPLLYRLKFFPRLEWLIWRVTGVRAGTDDAQRVLQAAAAVIEPIEPGQRTGT